MIMQPKRIVVERIEIANNTILHLDFANLTLLRLKDVILNSFHAGNVMLVLWMIIL
jgi:hypothetical protein